MDPNYDAITEELKKRKAIPLIIVYAVEGANITLDYLTTPAYEDADDVLKKDTVKATRRVVDELYDTK